MTANVQDVAKFILQKCGEMTAMKLQKLVYYSQAWSLVWDERPIFTDKIEAWANGPVCVSLYENHRGRFSVSQNLFADLEDRLDNDAIATIEAVLKFYGNKSAQWLSELTHREDPWKNAREGLAISQRSNREITPSAMDEYYSSL